MEDDGCCLLCGRCSWPLGMPLQKGRWTRLHLVPIALASHTPNLYFRLLHVFGECVEGRELLSLDSQFAPTTNPASPQVMFSLGIVLFIMFMLIYLHEYAYNVFPLLQFSVYRVSVYLCARFSRSCLSLAMNLFIHSIISFASIPFVARSLNCIIYSMFSFSLHTGIQHFIPYVSLLVMSFIVFSFRQSFILSSYLILKASRHLKVYTHVTLCNLLSYLFALPLVNRSCLGCFLLWLHVYAFSGVTALLRRLTLLRLEGKSKSHYRAPECLSVSTNPMGCWPIG